jgi:ferredoxin--NADP+ reductase
MALLDEYDTTNQFTARVLDTNRITPKESEEEVRDIVLEVDNKDFRFEVGQNVAVLVAGPHDFGHNHHLRLYTIANTLAAEDEGRPQISICVKRCSYIDDFSGEKYKGIASNYLCDLKPGDTVTLAGPYGLAFQVPEDDSSDILMIGLGTGIAPFRAFVKHIYKNLGGWKGRVRLFYGARSGLELLYMNDEKNDFANYYDEETFKAFEAVSPRPHWDDPIALDFAIEERAEEVWNMVLNPKTHVYVAGLEKIREMLDSAFTRMAGSKEKWNLRKAELIAGKRWNEIIY